MQSLKLNIAGITLCLGILLLICLEFLLRFSDVEDEDGIGVHWLKTSRFIDLGIAWAAFALSWKNLTDNWAGRGRRWMHALQNLVQNPVLLSLR